MEHGDTTNFTKAKNQQAPEKEVQFSDTGIAAQASHWVPRWVLPFAIRIIRTSHTPAAVGIPVGTAKSVWSLITPQL